MTESSASNRQLTLWRKLLQRKYREREGCFLAEGERCVDQILRNGVLRVREILLMEGIALSGSDDIGIPVYRVSKRDFASITDTDNPQGISALCEIPEEAVVEELARSTGPLIATDGVQDPGNLGTIIRTAAWFGAGGILSGPGTVDIWHPKVVRSSAGSTGILPVCHGDLKPSLARLFESGWNIHLLDGGEGAESLQKVKPAGKSVIVVGNEANGIRREILEGNTGWNRIRVEGAGSGRVESLNAAIALGIALYHSSSTIST